MWRPAAFFLGGFSPWKRILEMYFQAPSLQGGKK